MEQDKPPQIFVSHSSEDLWLASQIALRLEQCGVRTFLDVRDIALGDHFPQRIGQEMRKSFELVAIFTPWSKVRPWVRHEIGMADALGIRIVCVFYKVSLSDFDSDEGGRGPLNHLNIVDINSIETYFQQLRGRLGS